MEAWMAFVSIMAIVAIVVVAGGLIAFIAHMIIGVFDNNNQGLKKTNKDVKVFHVENKETLDGVNI